MKAPMVVTDLTRMQRGNVCIGGYLRDYTCVRPVIPFRGISEASLSLGPHVIRPFAVVAFAFLSDTPAPPHTEDREIHRSYHAYQQLLSPDRRQAILEHIDSGTVRMIFGAEVHYDHGWYVRIGEGTRSLGTIQPAHIEEIRYGTRPIDKWEYRIVFTDSTDERYNLAVTDLAFRYYLDYRRTTMGESPAAIAREMTETFRAARIFLRIGLTRGGRDADRCYLQITGVYTFPDYLDGHCFADFLPAETAVHPVSDDEIPF
ncbi:MAG: hypothetical protein ACR2JW_01165 [Thermomicrobiales bacterium]